MKILMFSIGFVVFVLYITGYAMMITKQNKIQSRRRRNYGNYGMDKLDDFPTKVKDLQD